jgi:phosphohistidine phosphatase
MKGIYPNLVLCSPSKRTKSSLKAYKEILGISCDVIYDEKLYETTYQDLLDIIYSINDDYDTVFLIAHNPSLNNLVDFLLRGFNENIPTSGVVGLEFSCNSWKDISDTNCSLTLFTYPKLINN